MKLILFFVFVFFLENTLNTLEGKHNYKVTLMD